VEHADVHWLDPDYLPETKGTLNRFVVNPEGDIDGLLLKDGTEIHTPPHLSPQLAIALAPGRRVAVRGVKPRDSDLIIAVAIRPGRGEQILDEGPEHRKRKAGPRVRKLRKAVLHGGPIERLLHGPKGDVHGALLEDGSVARFPPHVGEAYAALLVPGQALWVRGHIVAIEQGEAIVAEAMGRDESSLEQLEDAHEH
jgi:hypothetical protein